jgi:predicted TIM-barrel fold metal-dependent hydrolase
MRKEWLAQVQEDVLEPERPIIDPHHHLWRDKQSADYALDNLWADTASGHNIIGTVFVECEADYRTTGPEPMRPVGETEYVADIAEASLRDSGTGKPPVLGIVSHADLCLGAAVTEVIDAHRSAGRGRLRGIRHRTAYYPDTPAAHRHKSPVQYLMMKEDFREGFAQLEPAGMSFDAWLMHPQIQELTDLARAFPDTTIIFNHFGSPLGIGRFEGKRAEIFKQWKLDLAELASCENVVAKLGGLAMKINGWGWDTRDRPATSDEIVAAHEAYYLHTIDCFGPERCMFESNFPVDKVSVSYGVLWNAFKKMASRFDESEKTAMFRSNAERIYRLET